MINNIGTILGILFGVFIIGWSIFQKTDDIYLFLNVPSLEIVIGGLIAAAMISYGFKGVALLLSGFSSAMFPKNYKTRELSKRIIEYSKIAREHGFAFLENEVSKTDDAIEKEILELIAAGYSKKDILMILDDKIYYTLEKYNEKEMIFDTMFRYSPAFGMFGTIIGVVLMLSQLSSNPNQIGPSLAIALITTFYGLLFAYLLFGPIAEKLERLKEEAEVYYVVLKEGIKFVLEKRNEIFIQDALNSYLKEKR